MDLPCLECKRQSGHRLDCSQQYYKMVKPKRKIGEKIGVVIDGIADLVDLVIDIWDD